MLVWLMALQQLLDASLASFCVASEGSVLGSDGSYYKVINIIELSPYLKYCKVIPLYLLNRKMCTHILVLYPF